MHRRKRGALRSSSMNWIPLRRQPFQTLLELSITEKRQNKAKCPTWISIRLELVKKKKCLTLSKVLNISKAGAWVAPDLLKALEILWDSGLRRYAVDQEDLKPSFKSEKKATFLEVISKPIYKFSKDFPNYRKKTNRGSFSAVDLPKTYLNTETADETFQQSGNQDPFRHILKSTASIHSSVRGSRKIGFFKIKFSKQFCVIRWM